MTTLWPRHWRPQRPHTLQPLLVFLPVIPLDGCAFRTGFTRYLTFVPSAYPSSQLPEEWMNNVWMTHGERGNLGTLLTSTLINLTSDLYKYTGLPSSIGESPACPSSTLGMQCETAQCSRRRLSRTLFSHPHRSLPKQSFSIPESLQYKAICFSKSIELPLFFPLEWKPAWQRFAKVRLRSSLGCPRALEPVCYPAGGRRLAVLSTDGWLCSSCVGQEMSQKT